LTSLPKMLQVLLPLPLFFVSLFKETSWVSFFKGKDFLKNCTVTPKKLATLSRAPPHTADSLHTRITVFRGFQREYWSRKELKYFRRAAHCGGREKKMWARLFFSSVRLKMFTARFTQFKHSAAAILHSLIILFIVKNRNVEPFTQFHSSVQLLLKEAAQKNLWQEPAFHFFLLKILFKDFSLKHPSSTTHLLRHSLYFLDFLAQCLWNAVNHSPMLHPLTFHCTY